MTEYQKLIQKIIDNVEIQLNEDDSLDFEFKTFSNPAYTHIGIRGKEKIISNGITITQKTVFSDKYQQHTIELTVMLDFKQNYELHIINSIFDKIKYKFKKQLKREELI